MSKPKRGRGLVLAAATLALIAIVLAFVNRSASASQLRTAKGPADGAQRELFVTWVDRPDLLQFFKSLDEEDKLAIAHNIGKHDDPKMVELAGKLLEDFDQDVRAELADSLSALAQTQTEAVSKALALNSSFQRVAVWQALRTLREAALPYVAARMKEEPTRKQAVEYLVQYGRASAPFLMDALRNGDEPTKVAAASGLGQMRLQEAAGEIESLYRSASGDAKAAYLTALAQIGNGSSEGLLLAALQDEGLSAAQRGKVAVGLGRMRSSTALPLLWKLTADDDPGLAESAVTALQLIGPIALENPKGSDFAQMKVATGIAGPASDRVLAKGIVSSDRSIALAAIEASINRPTLVGILQKRLSQLDPNKDGDLGDAIIGSLMTTPDGGRYVAGLDKESVWAAFAERRRSKGTQAASDRKD